LQDRDTGLVRFGYRDYLLDRLLTVTRNGTQVESYAYDVNGRRFQTTSLLRGVSTCPSTYNTDDQRTKPRMRGESRR